jgi:hypothetical protein
MPSLFMVMLGGRHAKAITEVHDVVMAIGDDVQEIIPQLKQAWFGELKGLHIDAWAQFSGVQTQGVDYQIISEKIIQYRATPKKGPPIDVVKYIIIVEG